MSVERTAPDLQAGEREALEQWLDFHRATLLRKAEGLDREQLGRTAAATTMTLAGLLKHLALVEDWWFRVVLLGEPAAPEFRDIDWDSDPDWEWHTAIDEEPEQLTARYEAACAASREAADRFDSLDELSRGSHRRSGRQFSLRWIYLHMIEETARHNGHADLLREAIDGVTGE